MLPIIAAGALALASTLYAHHAGKKATRNAAHTATPTAPPAEVVNFPKQAPPTLAQAAAAVKEQASAAVAALRGNTGIVPPAARPAVQSERVVLTLGDFERLDGAKGSTPAIFREALPLL